METVSGKNITIQFDGKKCIHSRNCVLNRPDVFVPNVEGEWIYPDRATAGEIQNLALNCPSGAIRYTSKNESENEKAPVVNTVHIRENGPLAFHADLDLTGQNDLGFRITLCRCGASKNKPFCDSSHKEIQFSASGEPLTKDSSPLEIRNGKVTIKPTHNGPLKVSGNLEICSGTGRTIDRVQEAYLCRCGGSANKPFCDGTHKKNGFQG
ncbi:CDGSH iron-sulfur domain-containing protein [Leptospira kmetyi]|uniref:Iron-binding protein n=1 Tax=Leptospira kmetyi TaxID=408139 RepID=A0AAD0XPN7_9LEPT|nr:CDGSH iron-sulfur domain-containing protein [Leptospira kmetyi]AYV55402.1 iron-binding protein [Leptospira kmetyi]PJZ28835.1 iron-binding protein [Leptospira kmetyi]PJZ39613.1 iron-binding protein [Leptospira kmetyi]